MPMNYLKMIKSRRSTLDFSDKTVSEKDLEFILECARWSPSPHNDQPWSLIVVKDPNKIEQLVDLAFYGYFYQDPPLVVALVLEPIYSKTKILIKSDSGKAYAHTHQYFSYGVVLANLINAASSLGLSTCLLSIVPDKAAKIIGLPKNREVHVVVGIGYSKPGHAHLPTTRKPLSEIVFADQYGNRWE